MHVYMYIQFTAGLEAMAKLRISFRLKVNF